MADETPTTPSLSTQELAAKLEELQAERLASGQRSGPVYGNPAGIWFDQVFERNITPSGSVECAEALRHGATGNAMQVVLVASHTNSSDLSLAAGASVTLALLGGETRDGEFTAHGPSTTITVPTGGLAAAPDTVVMAIPLPDGPFPWLKVKLTFTGTISGGKLDCALAYVAR